MYKPCKHCKSINLRSEDVRKNPKKKKTKKDVNADLISQYYYLISDLVYVNPETCDKISNWF